LKKTRARKPSKKQLDREFAYFCPEKAREAGLPPAPPEFVERMDREYRDYGRDAFPNMPPPPGFEERESKRLKLKA
jgi:hypothetical protein